MSIHGHNVTDDQWHPACSSASNLVTLECHSRRNIKFNSKILSDILDDKTKKTIRDKWKKSNSIGCVVFLKANQLLSALGSKDFLDAFLVDVSTIGGSRVGRYLKNQLTIIVMENIAIIDNIAINEIEKMTIFFKCN